MKQIILLSAVLVVLAGKIHGQNDFHIPKTSDSSYTLFGVVYKDAFRWVDTIRNPRVETLYRKRLKYGNSSLTETPDRYKMIAELEAYKPRAVRASGYLV